jgi:hypothetical protein
MAMLLCNKLHGGAGAVPKWPREGRLDMVTGRPAACLVLAAALSAPALAWAAQPLYDTDRIIQYQRQECTAAAGRPCQTIHSRLTRVGVHEVRRMTLSCPSSHPYVVGWDAKRHEHLEVTVAPPATAVTPASSGKIRRLTVIAQNKAEMAGSFRLYVGCSTKPFDGTGGFMRQAQASPSLPIQPLEDRK